MILKFFAFLMLVFSIFVLHDRLIKDEQDEINALVRINPIPITKKMIDEKKYADAYEYLSFFMNYKYVNSNPEAIELLEYIKEIREDNEYKTQKIVEGILIGKSDELHGQVAALISDLFVFGDIRDLTIEGYNYLSNNEVDEVLVALSTIGVVATSMSIVSGGTTTTIKPIISFLKFTQKSGKLPKWVGAYIVNLAKNVRKSGNLKDIKIFFTNIHDLISFTGLKGGVKLLSKTSDLKSFNSSIFFAKQFGKNSSVLFRIVGNDVVSIYKNISKKGISKRVFLFASTFGKAGIKRLDKIGEKRFLKSLAKSAKVSRLTKIFDKNFVSFINDIPNSIFYIIILVCIIILV